MTVIHEEIYVVTDEEWESRRLAAHRKQLSFSLPDDMHAVNKHATELFKSIAQRVMKIYEEKKDHLRNGQLFVAVAGGPGSGKSTLAEEVTHRVNIRLKEGTAVTLPMDGFHYSRAQLREIAQQDSSIYTFEQLLARRGAPWTFDSEACIKAFAGARQTGKASLPLYSRDKSDPVPDAVALEPTHKIVFLEGNYLLSWNDPSWAPLKDIFDFTIYVACTTLEEQRERLINRHLKNWTEEKMHMWGEGRVGAANKADSNDVLNSAWIDQNSREHADLIVESK